MWYVGSNSGNDCQSTQENFLEKHTKKFYHNIYYTIAKSYLNLFSNTVRRSLFWFSLWIKRKFWILLTILNVYWINNAWAGVAIEWWYCLVEPPFILIHANAKRSGIHSIIIICVDDDMQQSKKQWIRKKMNFINIWWILLNLLVFFVFYFHLLSSRSTHRITKTTYSQCIICSDFINFFLSDIETLIFCFTFLPCQCVEFQLFFFDYQDQDQCFWKKKSSDLVLKDIN